MHEPLLPPERIVIRPHDLPPPTQSSAPPPGVPFGGSALPPLQATSPSLSVGGSSGLAKLGANGIVSGLLAGGIGGLLGTIVAEVVYSPDNVDAATEAGLRIQTGIWVAIIGAIMGALLMAWDGITSGSGQKAVSDGAIGAGIGAVAGFAGGYVAQWLFSAMLRDISFDDDIDTKVLLARVIAWGLFGCLLGIGLGLKGGSRKVVNGLIGGAIGGAAGGFMFQKVAEGNSGSATVPRFIGMTLTGIGIGLAIGLVERVRREAWVTISRGPMTGKEFILYNAQTMIGADHRCTIVLVRDPAVAPQHLAFVRTPQGTTVNAVGGPVLVNGHQVTSQRLRAGDEVTVGASSLRYQETRHHTDPSGGPMGMIDVTVVDVTGSRQQPASLPDDMAVGRVIARLTEMMGLPMIGPDGGPLSYRFHYKAGGRQLADHETLAAAGVRPNDVLRLQPEIIAGARP